MNNAILRVTVLATVVTMTSATITPTSDMVTVRLGEAIHLSCVVTDTDIKDISDVRWYRGTNLVPYGCIESAGGCPAAGSPCPEGITTDNRGTVRYEIGASNDQVLTLTINSSTLNDDTSFSCGILKVGGTSHTSSGITVTVYVPEATTPDGQQTLPGTTSTTASTTNSPATEGGSTSPNQTSTTTTSDTTFTTRQTTVGSTISPHQSINTTTKEDASSTTRHRPTTGEVTTTIEPDPGLSTLMTTIVTAMTTALTSAPGDIGSPVSTTIVIAVAVSACVIAIVLLIIIACLVSRKSRPSEPTLLNLTEPTPGSRDVNMYRRGQESPHLYEGTLARTTQPQDVESSSSELSPPIYATPSTRRKDQTACNVYTQQTTVPLRRPGHRNQHDDPEVNAVEPGQDKVGYPASEPPQSEPPEYAMVDPHSRPSSAVESGYSALRVAAVRPDQAEEGACAARPRAETPQPPEYAQLEPDSEPQTAGIPEPSSPEYTTPKPASGAAEYGTATSVNPDDVIPEHVPPEYATLEPDSEPQADTETSDYGDEVELLTDDLYAEPFPTM